MNTLLKWLGYACIPFLILFILLVCALTDVQELLTDWKREGRI